MVVWPWYGEFIMWGVILVSIGTIFEELASLLGKARVLQRAQSIYTMGFLQVLGTTTLFGLLVAVAPSQFVFSAASLPTFSVRAILEIFQAHYTMVAIVNADRSTYGFIRTGTMVLLLLVDLVLGYYISSQQMLGIGVIIMVLVILSANHGVNRKGIGPVLFTTINATATLSLYKYNITHFNSIPAEELLIFLIILFYFAIAGWAVRKENVFAALTKPRLLMQTLSQGVGGFMESFAFGFAPASIITAGKRSSAVLWAILAGNLYFKEKRMLLKIVAALIIGVGIVLLV